MLNHPSDSCVSAVSAGAAGMQHQARQASYVGAGDAAKPGCHFCGAGTALRSRWAASLDTLVIFSGLQDDGMG